MLRILLSFFLIITLSTACSKDSTKKEINTIAHFDSNLKPSMDYNAITQTFGEPDADIGSGIHIYVYHLDDATSIWIGYTDKIIYARQMNSNNQLIRILI